ncbi:MAG: hypothetical protein GXO31_01950 [Epsilonproteobacteria bacterium]|nr:hypothetical protein [Campylobacterota bacterium]
MKYIFIIISLTTILEAKAIVIVSSKSFPLDKLTKKQVVKIYLGKIRRIKGIKIVPVNLKADNPLRILFEKKILQKDREWLHKYWLQAHYHGHHPPKVFKSKKAALMFVKNFKGGICYLYKEDIKDKDIKILYEEEIK